MNWVADKSRRALLTACTGPASKLSVLTKLIPNWVDFLLRVIACIEDPHLIRKILGHLQRREALTGQECGLVRLWWG